MKWDSTRTTSVVGKYGSQDWDIVVLTFMLGGTALSFTSVVLAWRAVGEHWRAPSPHRKATSSKPRRSAERRISSLMCNALSIASV